MFDKKQCPRCGGKNINVVKESYLQGVRRASLNLVLPIRFLTGHAKKSKSLFVCVDDGFSWEGR